MKLDLENNIVARLLCENLYFRNDRKGLYKAVCTRMLVKQGYSYDMINNFVIMLDKVPRESTIIRECAVIQNTLGLYPPTEKVRKGRKEKEEKCREEYGEVKRKNWLQRILFIKIW